MDFLNNAFNKIIALAVTSVRVMLCAKLGVVHRGHLWGYALFQ